MADILNEPPYPTVLKPYGQSLVDLAKERDEVVCFTGDLTRQCEVDLFAGALPGPVHPRGDGRGEHDRHGRRAGP
jgi:transketolase C-terminal domain/subunit